MRNTGVLCCGLLLRVGNPSISHPRGVGWGRFRALTLLDDVVRANQAMLVLNGMLALILWLVTSSLMWLAMRHYHWALADTNGYFDTIPDAMWPILLSLTGEWPLADFSPWGMVLGATMILVSIGIFGNFIGIMADGFDSVFAARAALQKKAASLKVI